LTTSVAATIDFGIAYERATLTWFDTLPATLGIAPEYAAR
jgi:hypothetical protein